MNFFGGDDDKAANAASANAAQSPANAGAGGADG